MNGNLETQGAIQDDGSIVTDMTYAHDWRDRLVEVEQGDTTTKLVVDPLGRMVAKVKQMTEGDITRVYLHDGDQVVAEYTQEVGGTSYQLDRRKTWGQWIDDLVLEQVDADHDGALDTTLYPVKDLLGSVQLLTDEIGAVVERVEYDANGTPHFFSGDAIPPRVTRVAWTGDGNRPAGDIVNPAAFEIGFSEPLMPESLESLALGLMPEAGTWTAELTVDGRSLYVSGGSLTGGISYTLSLMGLKDRSGNVLGDAEVTFVVADVNAYDVLEDLEQPKILAVMDGADGIYLLFDEPVAAAAGVNLDEAITVERAGHIVEGSTARVTAQLLQWTATTPAEWMLTGQYEVTQAQVEDLAGQGADDASLPITLTHLAADAGTLLVAYQAAGDSVALERSAYGVTGLFQGRGWHADLGLYYYRARWYAPGMSSFLERDSLGYVDSPSMLQTMGWSLPNFVDPTGKHIVMTYFGRKTHFNSVPKPGLSEINSGLVKLAKESAVPFQVTPVNEVGRLEKDQGWSSRDYVDQEYDLEIFAISGFDESRYHLVRTAMLSILLEKPITEKIVLIGHSQGAREAREFSRVLANHGKSVELLVLIDEVPTFGNAITRNPISIAGNVKEMLVFYASPNKEQRDAEAFGNPPQGVRRFSFEGPTKLYGVISVEAAHTKIDNDPSVQKLTVQRTAEKLLGGSN